MPFKELGNFSSFSDPTTRFCVNFLITQSIMEEGGWESCLVFAEWRPLFAVDDNYPNIKQNENISHLVLGAFLSPRFSMSLPPYRQVCHMIGKMNLAAFFGVTMTLVGTVGERVFFSICFTLRICCAMSPSGSPFPHRSSGTGLFNLDLSENLWSCFVPLSLLRVRV